MGLILQTPVDNLGIEGNYWRIIQLNINFDRRDAVVTLQLYVSEEARKAGKNPLPESLQIALEGDLLDKLLDGMSIEDLIKTEVYEAFKLKAQQESEKAANSVDGEQGRNQQLAAFVNAIDSK